MSNEEIKIGEIVTGIYKTGKYIGEVTGIRPQHYLVKVKAVVKHPMQGDLHNPKKVDVPIFHERRALSFNEQTNIPMQMVHLFDGEIPLYEDSLRGALDQMNQVLQSEASDWANKCIANLLALEKDYFK